MMKAVWSATIATAAVMLVSTSVYAQTIQTGSINVTANVAAKAKLSLSAASITFADADPDVTPTMVASAVTIDVKARTTAAANVTLTVLASGDLVSGADTIGIGGLTWAATGSGYQATGTSNKTTAQTLGSWTGSGSPSGTQTYSLPNSWTYATGTYTVTLNYTLSVP
jgi:hypothetical protein